MAQRERKPKFAAIPVESKQARYKEPCIEGHPLAWRFSGCDRGGPFSWVIGEDQKYREVIEKLHEYEDKTWAQILETGSHPIEVHKICKEARDRLVEIERDDIDELMSFRLTGPNRVWCDKKGHVMRILWWDAEHKVYPTPKDHGDRKKANRRKGN